MKTSNTHYLSGFLAILILLGLCAAIFPVSATIFISDGTEIEETELFSLMDEPVSDEIPRVLFFYDPDCGACEPVHEFLDTFLEDNPDTILESINIADGSEEMDRFTAMKNEFSREKVFIPVIYIGPVAFEGTEDIMTYFEDVYAWYMNNF